MLRKGRLVACVLCTFLCACVATHLETADIKAKSDDAYRATSVCEIAMNRKSIGRIVRLNADYVADGLTYSYFTDGTCALELANKELFDRTKPTYYQFMIASARQCKAETVCTLRAGMDFSGMVVLMDSGKVGIDVMNVYSYQFKK